MPSFNDTTSQAMRMSGSFRNNSTSSNTLLGSKEDAKGLVDYIISELSIGIKKIQKDSYRTVDAITKYTKKKSKEGGILDVFTGGLWSVAHNYKDARSRYGKVTTADDKKIIESLGESLGKQVGKVVEKFLNDVTRRYVEYARVYEDTIKVVGTNLGISKKGYTDLVKSSQKYINDNNLSYTISTKDTMQSMAKLTQMGYNNNLETLSAIESMSDRISSTWNAQSAGYSMRVFDDSAYQLALGTEVVIRDALNDQFGDTQYIQNGQYKATMNSLRVLMAMQDTADSAYELTANITKNVGKIYEAGYSDKFVNDLDTNLELLSEGKYSDVSPLFYSALQSTGYSMDQLNNPEMQGEVIKAILTKLPDTLSSFSNIQGVKSSVAAMGALSEALKIGEVSDIKNAEKFATKIDEYLNKDNTNINANNEEDINAVYIRNSLSQQIEVAKQQLSVSQKIQEKFDNLVGTFGGSDIAQLGSSGISFVGGLASTVAGVAVTKGVTKLLTSKLGLSGTSQLGNLMSGGSTGGFISGGTTVNTLNTGANLTKLLSSTGVKVAGRVGGVLSVIEGVYDASKAIGNKTYSDNDFVNAVGGFVMGDQSGDQSAGGYLTAAGTNALKGAGIGAAIGSFFPGLGTVIGAGVGALVGAAAGAIGNAISRKQDNAVTATTSADATSSIDSKSIVSAINLQTDKLLVAIGNMYTLLSNRLLATSNLTLRENMGGRN